MGWCMKHKSSKRQCFSDFLATSLSCAIEVIISVFAYVLGATAYCQLCYLNNRSAFFARFSDFQHLLSSGIAQQQCFNKEWAINFSFDSCLLIEVSEIVTISRDVLSYLYSEVVNRFFWFNPISRIILLSAVRLIQVFMWVSQVVFVAVSLTSVTLSAWQSMIRKHSKSKQIAFVTKIDESSWNGFRADWELIFAFGRFNLFFKRVECLRMRQRFEQGLEAVHSQSFSSQSSLSFNYVRSCLWFMTFP